MQIRLLEGSQVKFKRAMAPIQQHTCARWHTGTHPNSVHTEGLKHPPPPCPTAAGGLCTWMHQGKEGFTPSRYSRGNFRGSYLTLTQQPFTTPLGRETRLRGFTSGWSALEHRLCWLLLTLCIQGVFGDSKTFATEDHLNKMPVKHNNSLWSWAREGDSLQNKF